MWEISGLIRRASDVLLVLRSALFEVGQRQGQIRELSRNEVSSAEEAAG